MDPNIAIALTKAGGLAALGLGAVGSGIGSGLAGTASIGAWKKCYAQGKAAPFILITFIGAPLSQTIYGLILMLTIAGKATAELAPTSWASCLFAGIFGGLGLLFSAWFQGKAGAAGADALAETGQGFTNYLMTLGVVETVALFVMVFSMIGI